MGKDFHRPAVGMIAEGGYTCRPAGRRRVWAGERGHGGAGGSPPKEVGSSEISKDFHLPGHGNRH